VTDAERITAILDICALKARFSCEARAFRGY